MSRRCWRCGVCEPSLSPASSQARKRRPSGADPHSPNPLSPSLPPTGRERGGSKKSGFSLLPRLTTPSSPGRRGGGWEKRAGVMRALAAATTLPTLFLLLLLLAAPAPLIAADRIVVGSKNFEESRLLAEMFAQLLESRTSLQVERRLGLAGTQVCFEALKSG